MTLNTNTVVAWQDAEASQYNNLRKDVLEKAWDYVITTWSANAYAISTDAQITAYVTWQRFIFEANFSATAAATLNVNTLWAKAIKDRNWSDFTNIVSGWVYEVIYDGTNMLFIWTPRATDTQATAWTDQNTYINPKQLIENANRIANRNSDWIDEYYFVGTVGWGTTPDSWFTAQSWISVNSTSSIIQYITPNGWNNYIYDRVTWKNASGDFVVDFNEVEKIELIFKMRISSTASNDLLIWIWNTQVEFYNESSNNRKALIWIDGSEQLRLLTADWTSNNQTSYVSWDTDLHEYIFEINKSGTVELFRDWTSILSTTTNVYTDWNTNVHFGIWCADSTDYDLYITPVKGYITYSS